MKSDVMPSIVQMDAEELQALTKEVKETVATEFQLEQGKKSSFSAVNMWNIRRDARSASNMLRK